MRLGLVALAVAASIGLAACGGEDAEPLTLEQRLPAAAEAPGWEADPVETRRTARGADEFVQEMHDHLIAPTQQDLREFRTTGFVSAILDTRFYPREPGDEHSPDDSHLRVLVMQFESEEGADKAIELLHEDGLRRCPGKCATQISEFDVDGTPDASGVHRFATAERIAAIGEEGPPYDEYAIRFADGPFAYAIVVSGRPGAVSEEQAEEIAEKLYDRVEGAPAPEQ